MEEEEFKIGDMLTNGRRIVVVKEIDDSGIVRVEPQGGGEIFSINPGRWEIIKATEGKRP